MYAIAMQDKISAAFTLPDTSKVGPFFLEIVKLTWIKHSKYYKGNDKLKKNSKQNNEYIGVRSTNEVISPFRCPNLHSSRCPFVDLTHQIPPLLPHCRSDPWHPLVQPL